MHLLQHLIQVAAPFVDDAPTAWLGFGKFVHGTEVGALLARVDLALAAAEAGRVNGLQEATDDTADELPRTAEQWSDMIHRALAQGWVRLISFPVVQANGTLSHRECPLRLMFDEKGEWVPAGRFLPVAERLRLTPALDLAAVNLGLKELENQPQLPGLAINLSASSVADASFRTALTAALMARKPLARRLWLEVAESGALKYMAEFRSLCIGLKQAGCHVGLEHFGHQFSQIGVLHDVGLDYLKVDASFVRGIEANAGNAAFLKGLCSIAHTIGLQVLAEGVATQAEWDTINALGFDGATGPGVREPLPAG